MIALADGLPAVLLRSTLALAAAAIVVRILISVLRPTSPAVQRMAWCLVLMGGLTMTRLPVAVRWHEPLQPDNATALLANGHVPSTSSVAASAAERVSKSSSPLSTKQLRPISGLPNSGLGIWSWKLALTTLWLLGMGAWVAFSIVSYVRFLRALSPAHSGDAIWFREWQDLLAERGVGRSIPLRVNACFGPMLCQLPGGYEVLVPEPLWQKLLPAQRLGILRHELAHFERGDVWKSLAVRLLAMVHWFNPCAWWAVRRFDECAEWACDQAVMNAHPEHVSDYAKALLQLGDRVGRHLSYNPAARGRSLTLRIRRLLAAHPLEDPLMKKAALLCVPLCLVAASSVRVELVAKQPSPNNSTARAASVESVSTPNGSAAKSDAKDHSSSDRQPTAKDVEKTKDDAGQASSVAERKRERETHPITVNGRATDADGKPIPGATITLLSTNGINALLATTTTAQDVRYEFRNAKLPMRREERSPLGGTLQVFGTARGYGFAWHGMRFFRPEPRPADHNPVGEDYWFFLNEPINMNLAFGPSAKLRGRVVDESAKPLEGVEVRVRACDYLDSTGKESHPDFRKFWSIQQLPASITAAKTDRGGHFELGGLPQDVRLWVRVTHPEYAILTLYSATTERAITEHEGEPVMTGELNLRLLSTRRINLQAVYADTGKPAAGIRVSASKFQARGYWSGGATGADGKLQLRLPPGAYNIVADPPRGVPYVRTRRELNIDAQAADQTVEVRVEPGCLLVLEAVDADTGKGIPNVTFFYESESQPGQRSTWQVQRDTTYVDNPVTDAEGRLRVVVYPGFRKYGVGFSPTPNGYRPLEREKGPIDLPAGKTVTLRFELRK